MPHGMPVAVAVLFVAPADVPADGLQAACYGGAAFHHQRWRQRQEQAVCTVRWVGVSMRR